LISKLSNVPGLTVYFKTFSKDHPHQEILIDNASFHAVQSAVTKPENGLVLGLNVIPIESP
jgi:hypothetical protein